jgi:meiosis induction protein kinase IME2/SME1
MTVVYDPAYRGWPQATGSTLCLEDKFEVLKEIGDGSFGSVTLARVRSAGANIARRGTLVCGTILLRKLNSVLTSTSTGGRQDNEKDF